MKYKSQIIKSGAAFALALLTIHPSLFGEITKVGTSSAGFLQMEVGARAIGMGGAYMSLADDASVLHWNPGGITLLHGINTQYHLTHLYAGMQHHFIGITSALGRENGVGLMVNYLEIGEMDVTTVLEPEGTGERFDAVSFLAALTYGRKLTDRVHIGMNFKYFEERIWLEKARGFALDFGTFYQFVENGVNVGMVLTNLGPSVSMSEGPHLYFQPQNDDNYPGAPTPVSQYDTRDFVLPMTFSLGVSANILGTQAIFRTGSEQRLTMSLAVNDGFDLPFRSNYGVEYAWRDILFLRGGLRIGYDMAQTSLGAGIRLGTQPAGFWSFDFAWSDYQALGQVTVWSIGYNR